MNVKEYEIYLNDLSKEIIEATEKAIKEACKEVVVQFKEDSPVVTGDFMEGWQATDNEIINDVEYAWPVIEKNGMLDNVNIEEIFEEKLNEELKNVN